MPSTTQSPEPDRDLIASVARCIELNRQHAELTAADTSDGENPEMARLDDAVGALSVAIRETPARSLAGVIAKAQLFRRLFAECDMKEAYALDPEVLGNSICRDLEQLQTA